MSNCQETSKQKTNSGQNRVKFGVLLLPSLNHSYFSNMSVASPPYGPRF